MSNDNPYSMHRQKVWAERAADPNMMLWIRVAALAFGCHRANNHAPFKAGEIAQILGTPGHPLRASSVSNAIKLAKQSTWIAEESTARCLVVPPHAVEGGLGHPNDRCHVHHKAKVHVQREQKGNKFTSSVKSVHVQRELASV
jgi:hypothetical protein